MRTASLRDRRERERASRSISVVRKNIGMRRSRLRWIGWRKAAVVRAVNRAEDTAHLQEKTGSQAARNGIPVLRVPASFKRPPRLQGRPLRVLSDGAVILSRAQRHPRSFQDCGGGAGVRSGLTCAATACAEAADVDGCGRSGSRAGRGRDSRCNTSPLPFDSAQSRRHMVDATIKSSDCRLMSAER